MVKIWRAFIKITLKPTKKIHNFKIFPYFFLGSFSAINSTSPAMPKQALQMMFSHRPLREQRRDQFSEMNGDPSLVGVDQGQAHQSQTHDRHKQWYE